MSITTYDECQPGNCTLGSHVLLTMQMTEAADADYDTATCVCISSSTPHAKGMEVTLTVGGHSLGSWCVEDRVLLYSGEKTLKWNGTAFYHLDWCTYKLRRAGYQKARATISRDVCPDTYPPTFCTYTFYNALQNWLRYKVQVAMTANATPTAETQAALFAATAEMTQQMAGRIPVAGPADVIKIICGWVGLSVSGVEGLTYMPDEYSPVAKPIISAVREVAGWSGKSVILDRTGALVVFDWYAKYAAGAVPQPASVLEEEHHDALYPTTHITVLGSASAPVSPGTFDLTKTPPVYVPADPTSGTSAADGSTAVEMTSYLTACDTDYPVEERIEIRDYSITPELALSIGGERLARMVLEAGMVSRRGPAEGSENIRPVTYRVFSVSRTLQWDGDKYVYEMSVDAPGSDITGLGQVGYNAAPSPTEEDPYEFPTNGGRTAPDPITGLIADQRRPFA